MWPWNRRAAHEVLSAAALKSRLAGDGALELRTRASPLSRLAAEKCGGGGEQPIGPGQRQALSS